MFRPSMGTAELQSVVFYGKGGEKTAHASVWSLPLAPLPPPTARRLCTPAMALVRKHWNSLVECAAEDQGILCWEWGIVGSWDITLRPPAPPRAPLWPGPGSERRHAAGWSRSRGDWAGCGWSSRGGRPGRRGWAPPPRDPCRKSGDRSHSETRPGSRKRCSRATGIPSVLQTGGGGVTPQVTEDHTSISLLLIYIYTSHIQSIYCKKEHCLFLLS